MYITITDYGNPRENSRSRVWTQDALGRDRTWVLSAAVTILGLWHDTLLESGTWVACYAPPDTRAASDAAAATSRFIRTSGNPLTVPQVPHRDRILPECSSYGRSVETDLDVVVENDCGTCDFSPITATPTCHFGPNASYTDTHLLRSGEGFHLLLQDRREFAEGVAVGPCIWTPCFLHRYTTAQGYIVMDAPCHASCTLCISMSGHGFTSKAQGFQFRHSLQALW